MEGKASDSRSMRGAKIGTAERAKNLATNQIPDGGRGRGVKGAADTKVGQSSSDGTRSSTTERGAGSGTDSEALEETKSASETLPQPRQSIGQDALAQLSDIISRLFPSDEDEARASPDLDRETADTSPSAQELLLGDRALRTADLLAQEFDTTVRTWFSDNFGRACGRELRLGYELIKELCGCYDVVLRRLARAAHIVIGFRAADRAERALRELDSIIRGERDSELICSLRASERELTKTPITDALAILLSEQFSIDALNPSFLRAKWNQLMDVGYAACEVIRMLLQEKTHLSSRNEDLQRALRQRDDMLSVAAEKQREHERAREHDELELLAARNAGEERVARMQKQMEKLTVTHDGKVTELKDSQETLLDELSRVKERNRAVRAQLQQLHEIHEREKSELETQMCALNARYTELSRNHAATSSECTTLREQIFELEEQVEVRERTLSSATETSQQFQRKLETLCEMLRLDITSRDFNSDVSHLVSGSAERIRGMLRDCVRKESATDRKTTALAPTKMDVYSLYESEVCSIVEALECEQVPMESQGPIKNERPFSVAAAAAASGSMVRKRKQSHDGSGGSGGGGCTAVIARPKSPKVQFSMKDEKEAFDEDGSSCVTFTADVASATTTTTRDNAETDYRNVHTIQIEHRKSLNSIHISVPTPLCDSIRPSDITLIKLGERDVFLSTLCEVLQVDESASAKLRPAIDDKDNTEFWEKIADGLDCVLVIVKTERNTQLRTYRGAGEEALRCVYMIVITDNTYYLLTTGGTVYTYNHATLPYENLVRMNAKQCLTVHAAVVDTRSVTLMCF